jgi:hypothetical protein
LRLFPRVDLRINFGSAAFYTGAEPLLSHGNLHNQFVVLFETVFVAMEGYLNGSRSATKSFFSLLLPKDGLDENDKHILMYTEDTFITEGFTAYFVPFLCFIPGLLLTLVRKTF